LICLKTSVGLAGHIARKAQSIPMPKLPAKALLTLLTVNRSRAERPNWDRIVTVSSIVVTVGLVALFAYGKATSRW
jgi:hypothetical protein